MFTQAAYVHLHLEWLLGVKEGVHSHIEPLITHFYFSYMTAPIFKLYDVVHIAAAYLVSRQSGQLPWCKFLQQRRVAIIFQESDHMNGDVLLTEVSTMIAMAKIFFFLGQYVME